jgi:RNA polymerase sigma-54 factor
MSRRPTRLGPSPFAAIGPNGRIVEILRKDGADIARQRVAKYREVLRIPSPAQRRREKQMGA